MITYSDRFSARSCALFFGAVACVVSLSSFTAQANLLAYEGFAYNPGSDIIGQIGGFGFANAWQTNGSGAGSSSVTVSGSLGYTDSTGHILYTSGNSAVFSGNPTANNTAQPNRDMVFQRGIGAADGTSTWVSMVMVRSGVATNNLAVPGNAYPRGANVSLFTTNGTERLAIGNSSGAVSNVVALIPAGSGGNIRPTGVSYSQLDFVVVRIDHIAGTNFDNAYIWLNPANLSVAPDISTAITNSIGSFDFSFGRIRPFAGGGNSTQPAAVLAVDEIRVGTEFADIAPWIPVSVPEPSVVMLGGLGGVALLLLRRRKV